MAKRRKMRSMNKPRQWFNSTIAILIVAFVIVTGLGIKLYGTTEVWDTILKYAIGSTATALFILILGFIFRKQLSKLIKGMMR